MVAPSPLRDTRHLAVGDGVQSWMPGFHVYGVLVDNDTGYWLQINPGGYMVPPFTYGWREAMPGVISVSLTATAGPAILPSIAQGSGAVVTLTADVAVVTSNGFTAVSSISTIQNAVNIGTITGSVTIGGPVDVSGSIVTASISNIVTITGSVDIGTISGGTVNIGTVTGDVAIIPGIFQVGGSGVTKISVTGTRVALRSTLAIKVVIVKARSANVDTIYLGASDVTNNETAGTGGLQLEPGDMVTFTETDIADIFLNGTAGDGVSYMYWT